MYSKFINLLDKEGHCPLRNSISKCSPRCVSDFQCSFNEKCCPNKCGSDSCAPASAVSTGNGYKGSSDGKKIDTISQDFYFFNMLNEIYFRQRLLCWN